MTVSPLGWIGIARLGLVQTALGAIVVLTTSTMNRIMVVELALPWLLLIRRTQTIGLALALAFHATLEIAARPDLLGWEMAALLLALWPQKLPPGSDSPANQGASSHGSEAAGQPMNP